MFQLRSEKTADLLAEKVKIMDEEASLLRERAQEQDNEVHRIKLSAIKVHVLHLAPTELFPVPTSAPQPLTINQKE